MLGAQNGAYVWKKDNGGSVEDFAENPDEEPPVEDFLGARRPFHHMVAKHPNAGIYRTLPGRKADLERLRSWMQSNVERIHQFAETK